MEKGRDWEQRSLISELSQGMELAKQLGDHLHPSSSTVARECLVKKILSSYDKALKLLKTNQCVDGVPAAHPQPQPQPQPAPNAVESPPNSRAGGGSPQSDGSDRDSKDHSHKEVFKKRKTQPTWTEHVRVCGGAGFEGPLHDGYSWRKYGQKEILGANFPRGYYRCSHRHVQSCLATKQVQRSDEDPSILEITYRGRHTCTQTSPISVMPLPPPPSSPAPAEATPLQSVCKKEIDDDRQPEEVLLNFKVKTEEIECKEEIFPSFSFSDAENSVFFSQSMTGNTMIGGGFSPAFVSPANSESDYFLTTADCRRDGRSLQSSESDLGEIISGPYTDTPVGSLDFSLDPVVFDPNFSFDALEFFP